MRPFRLALHALFLGTLNLLSILAGFGLYILLRPVNQILVQASAAALLSIGAYLLASALLPRVDWPGILLMGWKERAWVLAVTLLVTPLIFYPLHYLTQGYVAQFTNVLAVWAFQLPVNLIALYISGKAGLGQEHGHEI